jgi:hypothetical protein
MFKKITLAALIAIGTILSNGAVQEAKALTYVNARGEEFTYSGKPIFYVLYYRCTDNPAKFHSLVCRTKKTADYYAEVAKIRGSSTVFMRRISTEGTERVARNTRSGVVHGH